MWREEGFQGFMRGNGINCLRIIPYRYVGLFFCLLCSYRSDDSAVQFTTYEQLKKVS
jgi:solute carrier family 25 (mitochondrial phosphate transporter), member 23/24/25/41